MPRPIVIAVTGSSGFVGRAACRRLRADGHEVRPVTHRAPGPGLREGLRAQLAGADAVLHLAALAHRTGSDRPSESEYGFANAGLAECVALAARDCGIRRLVLMSSVAVHGMPARMPVDEGTPIAPVTAYGRSKALGERLVAQAFADGEWVILRPPVVHGPGQPGNLARLADAIDRRLPVPDFGPSVRRSTMAIDNLVDATALAILDPRAARRTYVLSDGPALTVRELASIAAKARGERARIVRVPRPLLAAAGAAASALAAAGLRLGDRLGEDLRRLGSGFVVDGSRFRLDLGWAPPVDPTAALLRSFARE